MTRSIVEGLVREVLERPLGRPWSLQGLGMLRLKLSPTLRLHVWSDQARVDDVSEIHTHPWNFRSYVVSGKLIDTTYVDELWRSDHHTHLCSTIVCGEGGGLEGEPTPAHLSVDWTQVYTKGQGYMQARTTIHSSHPEDGTVTIVERSVPQGSDPDRALVFWPVGTEWVSAEPRIPHDEEILAITGRALAKWS